MRINGQSLVPDGPARVDAACVGAASWRFWRERLGGRAWVGVEVDAGGGVCGRAWSIDVPGLFAELEAKSGPLRSGEPDTAAREHGGPAAIGRALIETAQLVATCRRHEVPLHVWLGGAIRRRVAVALPVVFKAMDRRTREGEIAGAVAALREAAATADVGAVAVHLHGTDVERAADAVTTVRQAVGSGVTLTVRLAGQFSPSAARGLVQRLRASAVSCVADPCSSIAASVEATRDELPALGLSAWRYRRRELLGCLAATPPAVLLVDPLAEGGPRAVREIGAIARVFQVDVGLTAEAGSHWLVGLAAELASVIPACRHPLTIPPRWTIAARRTVGVCGGAIAIGGGDATARPDAGPPVERA